MGSSRWATPLAPRLPSQALKVAWAGGQYRRLSFSSSLNLASGSTPVFPLLLITHMYPITQMWYTHSMIFTASLRIYSFAHPVHEDQGEG